MSWTLNNQTTDLVRRDDAMSSGGNAVIIFLLILFTGFLLAIPPMVFLSPMSACGLSQRSKETDAEQQNQHAHRRVLRPRTIAIRHPHDDGFVQIDIIDLVEPAPPPQSFSSPYHHQHHHHCQQHQQHQQQSRLGTANATPNFKTNIINRANEAGRIFAARVASLSQSIGRGFAHIKTKTSALGGGAGSHARRARRQQPRGLSIDLPVMKQPAWQRLASGDLSPATSLGDFIRQARDDAAEAAAAASAPAPAPPTTHQTTETPIYVDGRHMGRQAQVDDDDDDDHELAVETAAAATTQDAELREEAHGLTIAGVDTAQQSPESQVHIQKPEPVAVVGMGIAY